MLTTSKFIDIIKTMMKEEYRLHAAFIGKSQFFLFPLLIMLFSLIISISSRILLQNISQTQIYIYIHCIIFAYGFGVGLFAIFAESVSERRFKGVSLLLTFSINLPVRFKTIFSAFYIKDVLYYIAFTILPLILGIILSIPFTSFSIISILLLFLGLVLSFLLGISIMFFLSLSYLKKPALVAAGLLIFFTIVGIGYELKLLRLSSLFVSLKFQLENSPLYLLLSLLISLVLSVAASFLVNERIEIKRHLKIIGSFDSAVKKFKFAGAYNILLAKEWIDIRRSRTLYPIIGAYMGPLAFLGVLAWALKNAFAFPIPFNSVFYAGMIGFFGVTIYSWLNNIDSPDFYQTLPTNVPKVIRTRFLMCMMFASWISLIFVVAITLVNSDVQFLLISMLVAFTITFYTASVVAHLTGLRTNTYLFDTRILGKFSLRTVPPLIALIILSLNLNIEGGFLLATVMIVSMCCLLISAGLFWYKRIDKKWENVGFEM